MISKDQFNNVVNDLRASHWEFFAKPRYDKHFFEIPLTNYQPNKSLINLVDILTPYGLENFNIRGDRSDGCSCEGTDMSERYFTIEGTR